jgi:hypothetical protein
MHIGVPYIREEYIGVTLNKSESIGEASIRNFVQNHRNGVAANEALLLSNNSQCEAILVEDWRNWTARIRPGAPVLPGDGKGAPVRIRD